MVVIECEYSELRKMTSLSKEEVIDGLSNIGAPTEEQDGKLIVELTPNRPDLFFITGMARALNSFYKKKLPEYKFKKGDYLVEVHESVKKIRPYTICAVVKGVSLDTARINELIQGQEKLMVTLGRKVRKFGMGFFPLQNLSFPLSYTTMDPKKIRYKPLNYPRVADAVEILEKHPKGIEHGYLIRGFKEYPLYVDSKGKPMVLIPIVNSEEVGKMDEKTKDIFIEVTGTDMELAENALYIAVCTLVDMGGTAYSVTMHYPYDKNMEYPKEKYETLSRKEKIMKLDLGFVNKILGISLSKVEVGGLLKRMGFVLQGDDIHVPLYRADIMHFVDIVEDIAIAYGYNNFEPTIPNFFTPGKIIDRYDKISQTLLGMAFVETKNSILTSRNKVVGNSQLKEIRNPATIECEVLRPNLIGSILEVFSINTMKGLPQKIYEIGHVYEDGLQTRIIIGMMDKKINFASFRGYLQTFFIELGQAFELKKTKNELFDNEVSADIYSKGKKMGVVGKIGKKLLRKNGIEFEVYICELVL